MSAKREYFVIEKGGESVCYACFNRPAVVKIVHPNRADISLFMPVGLIEMDDTTKWCLECLLSRNVLSEEDLSLCGTLPTKEQIANAQQQDRELKERNQKEADCVCLKHVRVCSNLKNLISPDVVCNLSNFLFSMDMNTSIPDVSVDVKNLHEMCMEKLKRAKYFVAIDEKSMTDSDKKEFGVFLLWAGDKDELNSLLYAYAGKYYPDTPELLEMLVIANVFKVKTRCEHDLPRPYLGCQCDFHYKHWQSVLDIYYDLIGSMP